MLNVWHLKFKIQQNIRIKKTKMATLKKCPLQDLNSFGKKLVKAYYNCLHVLPQDQTGHTELRFKTNIKVTSKYGQGFMKKVVFFQYEGHWQPN